MNCGKNPRNPAANGQLSLHSQGVRIQNHEKHLKKKKKVIRMLIVVVLEFFICWTPIFVINSMDPNTVNEYLQGLGISIFHLLSYASSCCNPITYCFMNQYFRNSFLRTFGHCCPRRSENQLRQHNTDECRQNGATSSRRPTLKTTVQVFK